MCTIYVWYQSTNLSRGLNNLILRFTSKIFSGSVNKNPYIPINPSGTSMFRVWHKKIKINHTTSWTFGIFFSNFLIFRVHMRWSLSQRVDWKHHQVLNLFLEKLILLWLWFPHFVAMFEKLFGTWDIYMHSIGVSFDI